MKYLLFLLLPLLSAGLTAQITIDQSDMPAAGQNYEIYNTLDINGDFTVGGPNQIWDFSDLAVQVTDEEAYYPMDSVPLLLSLTFNFPFDPEAADFAMPVLDLPFALPIPISDSYQFYANKADAYKMLGLGLYMEGIPLPMKYDVPDVLYEFPLDFNDTYSSVADLEFSFPGLFYYSSVIDRTTIVDGWGTIYLPSDTFEVLRIASSFVRADSVYMDTMNLGFSIPPIPTTEYIWLAKNEGVPVLKVVDNGLLSTAYFTSLPDTTTAIGVNEIEKELSLNIYPNPGKTANIELSLNETSTVKMELLSIDGKILDEFYFHENCSGNLQVNYQFDESKSNGIYFFRITANDKVDYRSYIKQ